MVRDRQRLEVKHSACGEGPGTSGDPRLCGHQRLGKSGQEARVFSLGLLPLGVLG